MPDIFVGLIAGFWLGVLWTGAMWFGWWWLLFRPRKVVHFQLPQKG